MEREQSIEEFHRKFFAEAPYKSLKDGDPWMMPEDIPWFDKEKYDRGRKQIKNYCAIFFLGPVFTAIFVTGAKPSGKVFYSYGDFNPMYRFLLRRQTKLVYNSFRIFLGDVLNKSDIAIKNLRNAKGTHHRLGDKKVNVQLPQDIPEEYHSLAKTLREAVSMVDTSALADDAVDWDADPFSQLYCSLTYFGFYFMLWMNPVISSLLPHEVKDEITYACAVYGRLMPGIRDEYNVALHRDPELIRKVGRTFIGKILSSSDPTSTMFLYQCFRQLQTLSLGILNANACLAFFVRNIYDSDEKQVLVEQLSVHEKRMLNAYDKFFSLYLQNSVFRTAVNLLFHFLFMAWYVIYGLLLRFDSTNKNKGKFRYH